MGGVYRWALTGPAPGPTVRSVDLVAMTTTLAVLLIVNAAWAFVVWPQFFRRVRRDARARDAAGKPTKFLIVHAVLIGVSLLLAVISVVVGTIALVMG